MMRLAALQLRDEAGLLLFHEAFQPGQGNERYMTTAAKREFITDLFFGGPDETTRTIDPTTTNGLPRQTETTMNIIFILSFMRRR